MLIVITVFKIDLGTKY